MSNLTAEQTVDSYPAERIERLKGIILKQQYVLNAMVRRDFSYFRDSNTIMKLVYALENDGIQVNKEEVREILKHLILGIEDQGEEL